MDQFRKSEVMPLNERDYDLATRTILGEAADQGPMGMAGVAHVIMNRARGGDTSPSSVVLAPGQFEPWMTRRRELLSYSPQSPLYQQAARIFDGVVSGEIPDPTAGATHFFSPAGQRHFGRADPAWSRTQKTAQIGGHKFYAPEGRVPPAMEFSPVTQDDVDETSKIFGLKPGAAPAAASPDAKPASSDAPVQDVSPDEINATAKEFGLGSAPVSKPAADEQPITGTVPVKSGGLGFQGQVLEGMPIIGPLVQKAAAATVAALPGGKPYEENLAAIKQGNEAYATEHPVASTVGNVVGGGMLAGPAAGTTAGAVALGLPNATRMGATVGGRLYGAAAAQAGIGAADAALRGENPITGAEVGAAGGAGGVLAGHWLGNAVSYLQKELGRVPGALAGVNRIGREWLSNALVNETDQSLAAARGRMGPEGFLADVNPNTTELAAGIANRPEPPASSAVGEAYRTRDAGQRAVIDKSLDTAFGPKVDIEQFRHMITEERARVADPLYEQFRSMEVPSTEGLQKVVARADKAGAIDEAKYLAGVSGKPLNLETPTPQTYDLVKRGLDSKIEAAYAGGNKTRAATLLDLKHELIDEVGKTPAGQVWNQARGEFADRSALLDQTHAGQDTFLGARSGLSVDELREELRGFSRPELAARIVGARNAADEVMGGTLNGDTTLRNKFLAPNNRAKLEMLIGKDKAKDLVSTLEQQQFLSGQAKYVNPRAGSPTAPRTAAINALEAPPLQPWNPNIAQPLSFIPPSGSTHYGQAQSLRVAGSRPTPMHDSKLCQRCCRKAAI